MNKTLVSIFMVVLGLIVPVTNIVMKIQFNQECGGFLKQAADANTPELALDRINIALEYIEKNDLTNGYTSVFWRTEADNVRYWYKNIKACQSELKGCLGGTQLEKSNVLMKVRESLTDNGKDGTELTIPAGISRYPHNAFWGILRFVSYIILCAWFLMLSLWIEEY